MKSMYEKEDRELISDSLPTQSFFTPVQAAKAVGCSSTLIYRLVAGGELRVFQRQARQKGSRIRIPRAALVNYLAAQVL
jgi:excisionase family DNA binding protein